MERTIRKSLGFRTRAHLVPAGIPALEGIHIQNIRHVLVSLYPKAHHMSDARDLHEDRESEQESWVRMKKMRQIYIKE